MGTSLKFLGEEFSKSLIATTSNPFVGLFIGILATSIIQSSSSITSIVVGMVGVGALTIDTAIPVIMGANIGTAITNTIASLPQINRVNEFKRAFSAATVHDLFNLLSVAILFPLQFLTNFLGKIATVLERWFSNIGGLKLLSPVNEITRPAVEILSEPLKNMPWIFFIIALILLFISIKFMVSSIKVIIVLRARDWFDRYLFKTAFRAFTIGLVLTVVVQSSSMTTSLIVPMAGAGLLSLEQIFLFTLGANIGTTLTAILAALLTGSSAAVIVAFSHLVFNILGITIWWPLKNLPIQIARKFSEYAKRNKIIPVVYVLSLFFILPLILILIFN
jgi:sodium-dependent phosphate cotransporter